jgi:uncharacterized membrane protein
MIRDAFLARLRQGLSGMPAAAIDDIVSDYEAHFTEGQAAGRSEEAVAQALGDPGRLARELKAEAGLKRWEEQRNPTAAAGAIFAVLGLGAIDLLILAPVLVGVGSGLFGLFAGAIGVFFAGTWVFVTGLFNHVPSGGPTAAQAAFAGLGMMSGSISAAAVLSLVVIGLINLLVRYGRLHYRLLQPAVGA